MQQLGQRQAGGIVLVVESPEDSQDSFGLSSSSGAVSSEAGDATQVFTSTVQIVELENCEENSNTDVGASNTVLGVPTPDQPIPARGSARVHAGGVANSSILQKVMDHIATRDKAEGNPTSKSMTTNSFSILADEEIVNEALEIGVDITTLRMETIHMIRDLENARNNLINQKQKVIDQAENKKDHKGNAGEEPDVVPGTSSTEGPREVESSDEIEKEFTPEVSKKARRNATGTRKVDVGVPLGGTFSLGKGAKHHPLRDVVVGPRTRSKTK